MLAILLSSSRYKTPRPFVLDLENTALGTSSELRSPFKLASIMESELKQAKLCFSLETVASIEDRVRDPSTRRGSALTIFLEPCYSIIILSYLFKCLSYDARAGVPLLEDSAAMGCFILTVFWYLCCSPASADSAFF